MTITRWKVGSAAIAVAAAAAAGQARASLDTTRPRRRLRRVGLRRRWPFSCCCASLGVWREVRRRSPDGEPLRTRGQAKHESARGPGGRDCEQRVDETMAAMAGALDLAVTDYDTTASTTGP
jgi:hypothetical protein